MFQKIIQSDITIIIFEGIILAALLVALILILRRKKVREKLQGEAWAKTRERDLNGLLENRYASEELKKQADRNVPYEVKYKDAMARSRNAVALQITEHSGLSIQKYIFNVENGFYIGKAQENELVLKDALARDRDVELIQQGGKVYLKKADAASTLQFQRGKKKYRMGENPVELCDNDIMIIGGTSLEVMYIK